MRAINRHRAIADDDVLLRRNLVLDGLMFVLPEKTTACPWTAKNKNKNEGGEKNGRLIFHRIKGSFLG